jgi:PAS domain S-box-containing protein
MNRSPVLPPQKPRRPRWHWIYFLLAAFNVATVCLGLFLTDRIMRIYTHSVDVNEDWVNRRAAFSKLGDLAQAVHAPGIDVFNSHDVKGESARMQTALDLFNQRLAGLREELRTNDIPDSVEHAIKADLDNVQLAMAAMVKEAGLVFQDFELNQPELAGRQMAVMDHKLVLMNDAFRDLRNEVTGIQKQTFDQQLALAGSLQKSEFALAGTILLMIGAATYYGLWLLRHARGEELEREAHIVELKAAQDKLSEAKNQLEQRVQERSAELSHANELLRQKLEELERNEQEIRELLKAAEQSRRDQLKLLQDQKLVAAALRASQERFEIVARATNDVIWDWDLERGTQWWNGNFLTLFGYQREEVEPGIESWTNRIHPDDLERVNREIHAVVNGDGQFWSDEYRFRRADGSYASIYDRGFVMRDKTGKAVRMTGAMLDITARKQAEEEARLLTQRLTLATEAASIGIWDWDIATDHWYTTPTYFTMLGYKPYDGIYQREFWMEQVHPEDRAMVQKKVQAVLAGNDNSYQYEARIRHRDGTYHWINIIGRALTVNEHGQATRMLGVRLDITERKRAEAEIRQLNQSLEKRVAERTAELAAKNKELETFSYSVSHDLKAPLRGIDGYSRLLLSDYEDKLDEDGRSFLKNIRSATSKMQELIDDLLAYSRLERRTLSNSYTDLKPFVAELLNERRHELERVQLTVDIPDKLALYTDQDGLTMALRNLIDNAVKFSSRREPPAIEIRAWIEGSRCRLSVRDNGSGFEMQYHDRIFEIFQRLHRAEDYPGTGVGLAIVQKVMERVGGRVWAESELEKGAVFFLDLPLDGIISGADSQVHNQPGQPC